MKEMKRIISMVLCLVMLLSLLPAGAVRANAAAIETGAVVDAAIMFSDLHTGGDNPSTGTDESNYKADVTQKIFAAFKNTGLPFSSVTSCGDAFSVNADNDTYYNGNYVGKFAGKTSAINANIRSEAGLNKAKIPVYYVWSDHDRYALQADDATPLDRKSKLVYGAGADGRYGTEDDADYYIYSLSMGDLSSFDRYNAGFSSDRVANGYTETVEKAVAGFTADAGKLLKDRPLLIASHQPLFDNRNDNAFAELWFDAINAVAEDMDVVFFFGHNHKYDASSDYYMAKGTNMKVATADNWSSYAVGKSSSGVDLSSRTKKLNFTHLCTGYLSPATESSTTRKGTAVAVTVYENAIGLTTYNSNGVYTGSYALNETINRDHKLSSISVTAPEKVDYIQGEEFDTTGLAVTATYGSTRQVEVTDYTVSEVDMNLVGEQTVTVSYQDKTATFTINVAEDPNATPTLVSIEVTKLPNKTEYLVGEEFSTEGMEVTATFSDGESRVVTGWSTDEVDMTTPGTKKVGVYYSVLEVGQWAEFEIVVKEVTATEPPATEPPATEPPVTEPKVEEQTFLSDDTFAAVTATATNATLNPVIEDEKADALLSYWFGYDIRLEGQVADTPVTVTLWLDPDGMSSDDLAVYHLNETTGAYEAVTGYTLSESEDDVAYITITNAALGTYVYGEPADIVEEGAKLDHLKLTPPTKTAYFDSDVKDRPVVPVAEGDETTEKVIYLDITGLEVIAVYDNGDEKELAWDEFGAVADGYALTFDALVVDGQVQYGKKTVTVSYQGKTATFDIRVCKEKVELENDVTIVFDTPSVESIVVETPETVDEVITNAVAEVLTGDVTVFDIKPTYAEGYDKLEGTATVTLPLPEGLEEPAVYYVSDDGSQIEDMKAQVVDGKLVFTTTHFSKYVVGETATIGGGSSTTKKTVYVKVNSITAGKQYLIVDTGTAAGDANMLRAASNNGIGNTADVVIKEGTTSDGTIYYIESADDNAVWIASNGNGFRFQNVSNSRYLYNGNNGISLSITGTSYTYSNNFLYGNSRYLFCNSGSWTVNRNSANNRKVYFYELTEDVDVTETVVAVTYSIEGSAAPATAAALAGQTVALSYKTYSQRADAANKTETTIANADYKYTFIDDEGNEIPGSIGTISGSTLTLNGTAGTARILVVCTWTQDDKEYQITDDFTVTAKAPNYHMEITMDGQAAQDAITVSFVEENTPVNLGYSLSSDMTGVAPAGGEAVWTVDGDAIIKKDDQGNLVYTGESGTAVLTLTYTWTDANGTVQTLTDTITVTTTGAREEMIVVESDMNGDKDDTEVKTVVVKGVKEDTVRYLDTVITEYTQANPSGSEMQNPIVKWEIISDTSKIFDENAGITLGETTGNAVEGTGTARLNFSGNGGMATVRAYYDDDTFVTFSVNASKTSYYTPEDGTNDFPDYPNPGSVVINKTATPVGDFNKTGTAMIELNMFGVPAGKGVDVIVMLDMSSSMDRHTDCGEKSCSDPSCKKVSRLTEMIEALEELETTLKASNNSENIRIAIADFNGVYSSGPTDYSDSGCNNTTRDVGALTNASNAKIYTGSHRLNAEAFISVKDLDVTEYHDNDNSYDFDPSTGTNYDYGFDAVYQLGYSIKKYNADNKLGDRELFVIFMSDGAANQFNYYNTTGGRSGTIGTADWDPWLKGELTEANASSYLACTDHFYYYDAKTGNQHRMANAIKGATNQKYEIIRKNQEDASQQDILTPLLEQVYDENGRKLDNLYNINGLGATTYTVAFYVKNDGTISAEAAKHALQATASPGLYLEAEEDGALTAAFKQIGGKIADAATNVAVNDLIAPCYSMTFEFPQKAIDNNDVPTDHEFYIEVVEYELGEVGDGYERTGNYESLIRVYPNDDNTFRAARVTLDENKEEVVTNVATAYAAKAEGEKGYFSLVDGAYVYVADGTGTHNITAGVYYSGTVTVDDDKDVNGNAIPENQLVLITPYFTYFAEGQKLDWTTDKLTNTSQIALRYFVYLEGSADDVGEDGQIPPGVYQTNTKATVSYTNHLGHECVKTFPVPQMTWSGAQVGVSFYLVNAQGQPINRSGEVVPLAAATFVTNTFYESVVWNTEKTDPLRANILANEYLPEEYDLYDPSAAYTIHVYKNEEGRIYNDFFEIAGVENVHTTFVYNTINGTKYNNYGVYSGTIPKGEQVTYQEKQEDGTFVDRTKTVNVNTGDAIDYSSTNVAFAVVWIPTLAEDTIVVDFGLPVAMNVTQNDQLDNTVNSIGTMITDTRYEMNTGVSPKSIVGLATGSSMEGNTLILPDGNRVTLYNGILYFTQSDMTFEKPSVFYYDSTVSFTAKEGDTDVLREGYMYSKVTVIPATTVYYEDEYVDLSQIVVKYEPITLEEGYDTSLNYLVPKDGGYERVNPRNLVVGETYFLKTETAADGGWTTVGSRDQNIVQGTDRPGEDKFHLTGYDADNIYGYDKAYTEYSKYSLGSAAMFTADKEHTGIAEFEFYGTGFDIISVTSNKTGRMTVKVYPAEGDGYSKTAKVAYVVDTYYGYQGTLHNVTYTYNGSEWIRAVGDAAAEGAEQTNVVLKADPAEGDTCTAVEYVYEIDNSAEDNALYQIPVMKVAGLTYGKYKAEIRVSYSEMFNHTATEGAYDFYLDAIRIYDPCGVDEVVNDKGNEDPSDDVTVGDIYNKDGELEPEFHELRNWILKANDFNASGEAALDTYTGAVFIDGAATNKSVSDYKNFGPNNEVYLAKGQAVAFKLNAPAKDGYNVNAHIAWKGVGGAAKVEVYYLDAGSVKLAFAQDVNTATDLYYDITDLLGKTLLIKSAGENVLSVTNLKFGYQKIEVPDGQSSSGSNSATAVNTASEEFVPFTIDKESVDAFLAYMNMFLAEVELEATAPVTDETEEATEPEAEDKTEKEESKVEDKTEKEESKVEDKTEEEESKTEDKAEKEESKTEDKTEKEESKTEDKAEKEESKTEDKAEKEASKAEDKTEKEEPQKAEKPAEPKQERTALEKILHNLGRVYQDIVQLLTNLF